MPNDFWFKRAAGDTDIVAAIIGLVDMLPLAV
jgi:hypothetical protein